MNSLTGGFFRLLSSPAVQHPEGFQRLFAWRALRQSLVGGANGSPGATTTSSKERYRRVGPSRLGESLFEGRLTPLTEAS